MADTTSQKGRPARRKKVRSSQKKVVKLNLSGSGTPKCPLKKTSPPDEKVSGLVTTVTRQKTNLGPDTGPVKHGKEDMKILELLAKLEKHEAECNLRYQQIEEKLSDHKNSLKAFDLKLWGLAVLILIAPFVGKLLG